MSPLSADPEKRARQEAALRKGNPRAFTKTPPAPPSGGGGKPTKRRKPTVRAGAPPAQPKARRQASKPKSSDAKTPKRRGGFWRGLLD